MEIFFLKKIAWKIQEAFLKSSFHQKMFLHHFFVSNFSKWIIQWYDFWIILMQNKNENVKEKKMLITFLVASLTLPSRKCTRSLRDSIRVLLFITARDILFINCDLFFNRLSTAIIKRAAKWQDNYTWKWENCQIAALTVCY